MIATAVARLGISAERSGPLPRLLSKKRGSSIPREIETSELVKAVKETENEAKGFAWTADKS